MDVPVVARSRRSSCNRSCREGPMNRKRAMSDATDRITPATTERDTPVPTTRDPALAPDHARGNGRPGGPDAVRREIEATRARMSRTLDELEHRIVRERRAMERKKEELWDKATLKGVRRKLSREPWRSVGIAFAVGYIIAAIRD